MKNLLNILFQKQQLLQQDLCLSDSLQAKPIQIPDNGKGKANLHITNIYKYEDFSVELTTYEKCIISSKKIIFKVNINMYF